MAINPVPASAAWAFSLAVMQEPFKVTEVFDKQQHNAVICTSYKTVEIFVTSVYVTEQPAVLGIAFVGAEPFLSPTIRCCH